MEKSYNMEEIINMYCNAYNQTNSPMIIEVFNTYKNRIHKIGNMVVIYYTLTDETYDMLKNNRDILADGGFSEKCFAERGSNIHIIKAFGKGMADFKKILNYFIDKYNPKTISAFKDNSKKVHELMYKRRMICLG